MADERKTALVTGGNRGLGLEVCRQLAQRDYGVILTSRDADEGMAEADRLGVEYRQLDVADAASIAALAEGLARADRRIDVLVNNAAVSLKGFDSEVVRKTLGVNFFGAMSVTEALEPFIPDGGTIVMVSSGMGELSAYSRDIKARFLDEKLTRAGLVELVDSFAIAVAGGTHTKAGWPSSAYRVSKAALNALARILARDLAGRGIRVNAVCPGWVRTDMGGPAASRPVEKGGASIVWAAVLEDDTTGGFFRDGRAIPW